MLGPGFASAALLGCGPVPAVPLTVRDVAVLPQLPELPVPPNVLLVLLDDVGNDKVEALSESPSAPSTPTLSALAAEGVVFRNAWASPICAPTRAMLLTGRQSRRYGLGEVLDIGENVLMPATERFLPALLAQAPVPYASAAFGKWHLAGSGSSQDYMRDPLNRGFLHHSGTPSNVYSYFAWAHVEDGFFYPRTGYLTTETVDDALDALQTLPEPWLVYLAPLAPHSPVHAPPDLLNPNGVLPTDTAIAQYDAALTAVDLELGRLIEGIPAEQRARTMIIVMGDNGTPFFAVAPPFDPTRAKVTMFEGGINVPLIVSGPMVAPGTQCDELVSVVDVLATLCDIAGLPLSPLPLERSALHIGGSSLTLDGVSFLPQLTDPDQPGRDFVYSEVLHDNGPPPWPGSQFAVRDARYKLIRREGADSLYDLSGRFDDGEPLLEPLDADARDARDRLVLLLAATQQTAAYEGDDD